MSNIFHPGYWYKQYVNADDPVEVLYEFIDSFVNNKVRNLVSYNQLFKEFDSEAIRMSNAQRDLVTGYRLSDRFFRTIFVYLAMSAALEKNKTISIKSKLSVLFKSVNSDFERYNVTFEDPKLQFGEEVSQLNYNDGSSDSSVPLIVRLTDPWKTGSVFVSSTGKRWSVCSFGKTEDRIILSCEGKERTFMKEIVMRMKRESK